MTWLDRIVGRVTMYRLVLILLIIIAVYSFALAGAGLLAFGTLDLLASLVAAVVVTTAVTWLVGLAFRARPHLESSLITGLLLFFVLGPSTKPTDLLVIALAGAVAGASKFVLAWRGRHIVNPAAIGAVAVTATGLTYSAWWVATPYLLTAVAIASFLILYRTRRLAMGVLFVVLAGAIEVIRLVAHDTTVGGALSLAYLSLPIVFFAGFMLSEPLTLPPRRWQQLLVAVVTAALFALPLHVGSVFTTPQLALVIGNLVAFAFGQRRGIVLDFVGRRQLSASTWEFAFEPVRPVAFRAGQFMELTVPHTSADFRGSRRIFSISSAPATDGPLTFAMTIAEKGSSFKRALFDLVPGERIRGTSVGGDFTLPADRSTPTLLVAGGIGITPFSSQLADATAKGHERDVVVVYAVSDPVDIAYADVLEGSGVRVVLVAPSAPEPLPRNWEYAGSGRITRDLIAASVPDVASRRAYVSGPPALVTDVRRMLGSLGSKRVVSDYFSGY